MKDRLFDCYRQYQKSAKDNIFKAFFKLPIPAVVLLSLSLVCVVLNFVVILCNWVAPVGLLLLIAEMVICIALYLFTDNYQIKNSDTRINTYVNYCAKLSEWLRETGFVVTKENIIELRNRVNQHISDDRQRKKENQERFDKWCQALLFPILLAVFSTVIKDQTDILIMLGYAMTMIVTIGLLYLGAYHCVNVISFFEKRRFAQMQRFAEDLQGILDTQFDDRLILWRDKNPSKPCPEENKVEKIDMQIQRHMVN